MARIKTASIGIAITTHNRYEVFKKTFEEIKKYAPPKAKIVVVDDASETPVKEATYRFNENVGIAAAKNKCFELLEDCDHLFLFDDDTYPRRADWWKPYVESEEAHLSYAFIDFAVNRGLHDNHLLYTDGVHSSYAHQRGCMLYYKKRCLERVGGMDPFFGKWGYEHVNLADRIYNAGLTSFRYMDVANSDDLIYSGDEYQSVESSCAIAERAEAVRKLTPFYQHGKNLSNYIDYRTADQNPPNAKDENVVITTYFTSKPDIQRGVTWEANPDALLPLLNSVKGKARLIVINDCFDLPDTPHVRYVKVKPNPVSVYWLRWIYARQWLNKHPEVKKVWMVDATDVEMVNSPFAHMEKGMLYIGDENEILGCNWMLNQHHAKWFHNWVRQNPVQVLLNCGLFGGERQLVLRFLNKALWYWEENRRQVSLNLEAEMGIYDNGIFNYVARTYFPGLVVHGRRVNTVFKRYQHTVGCNSWWKHK